MSLALSARFARRELRAGVRGFRIFIACLALGVAAIAGIGTVRAAIEAGITANGARLLGGDAELEFTYRYASDEERAWMAEVTVATSEIVDFRSMAVVVRNDVTERGLTQVKAVDGAYPLIGEVILEPAMPLSQALGDPNQPGAVMERVLADRLDIRPGDSFALGTQEFTLSAILIAEPDAAAAGFGLGPRTIVAARALESSGLIQPGTLYTTKYRLDVPEGAELTALETEVEERFSTSGVRWNDARNGAPGVSEFVERIGSFLILVGLSGLAVGGIGVSSAVRAYLASKTSVIATLKTLGAERGVIFRTYFLQIGALSLLGIALGLAIGATLPIALAPVIVARLPVPAEFTIYAQPLLEAALYGALSALIFTLWPLARAEEVRAATLFREALDRSRALPRWPYVLATVLLLALLISTASAFSGAVMLTLWTAGGIAAALAILAVSALGVRWISRRVAGLRRTRGRTSLRLALSSISGPREQASSVVLSLGLGLSVLAAVGQIDGNLRQAIENSLPDVAPSYFFVDIQSNQLPGFRERLDGDPAVSRVESAPMLRGIVSQINGRPARETAGDHWVLEGDRGVTYAALPSAETRITEGNWWPEDYSGPPLISFAAEEAEEMGLAIGDMLTVNILGRDITGEIVNFREVDFSTAGIGFILTMNQGALA
ncbi:MAG: FtsX-like permease family protein, partial [Pseudomonadota bacterium]